MEANLVEQFERALEGLLVPRLACAPTQQHDEREGGQRGRNTIQQDRTLQDDTNARKGLRASASWSAHTHTHCAINSRNAPLRKASVLRAHTTVLDMPAHGRRAPHKQMVSGSSRASKQGAARKMHRSDDKLPATASNRGRRRTV